MKLLKKIMAVTLSATMVISCIQVSNTIAFADDNNTVIEETTDNVTETTITEDTTEIVIEDEVVTDETNVEEKTTTEEITTEEVTTEESKEEVTTEVVDGTTTIEASELNYRLLVATDDESILTNGYIISSYEGVYLIGYTSEENREEGYNYYQNTAIFVEKDDKIFEISDEEGASDVEVTNSDDALTILNDLDESEITQKTDNVIAVIDTGISEELAKSDNIIDSISVIGDSYVDDNGHGTEMVNYILEENPKAKIISIKAIGSDGKASASDIYAAIRYAIDNKVSIINLSFSALSTEKNSIVKNIILEAIENDIDVVGSAGNNGKDVKYFIPSNIDEAYIIGACDTNNVKIAISNFGNTIDYYVVANSTSEATARFTGNLSINNITKETIKNPSDIKMEDNTETDNENDNFNINWEPVVNGSRTGEYFSKVLGLNNVTRQSILKTIQDNWTAGLNYSNAHYHGFDSNNISDRECLNMDSNGYQKQGGKSGIGYNCTGFATSVLYYANTNGNYDYDGAYTNIRTIFNNNFIKAALSKKYKLNDKPVSHGPYNDACAISNLTNWTKALGHYEESNVRDEANGNTYDYRGYGMGHTITMYDLGKATNATSAKNLITNAERNGLLKPGYILLFQPSDYTKASDSHIGFYAGNGQMYSAIGGTHGGVTINSDVALHNITSKSFPAYVYILPLPEDEGEFYLDMKKEKPSSYTDSMAGTEYTVTYKGGTNRTFTTDTTLFTAVLDENGRIASIKNVNTNNKLNITLSNGTVRIIETMSDARISNNDYNLYISVKETKNVSPYNLNNATHNFTIKTGSANICHINASTASDIMVDVPYKNILYITKSGTDNTALNGAVFNVYKYSNTATNHRGQLVKSNIKPTKKTLADGDVSYAIIKDLDDGDYWVEEVTPPSGYSLPNPVGYKVTLSGALQNKISREIANATELSANNDFDLIKTSKYPQKWVATSLSPIYSYSYYYNHGGNDLINNLNHDANTFFTHFINYGIREGRTSSEVFSWSGYRKAYTDLQSAFDKKGASTTNIGYTYNQKNSSGKNYTDVSAYYLHFVQDGIKEGRFPNSASWLNGKSAGAYGQNSGMALVKFVDEEETPIVISLLKKCATNKEYLVKEGNKTNPNYSLDGTTYTIHSSATATSTSLLATVTLDANGNVKTITTAQGCPYTIGTAKDSNNNDIKGLLIQKSQVSDSGLKLYYKETTAGKGYNLNTYNANTDYFLINKSDFPNNKTTKLITKTVYNDPGNDPMFIKAIKIDKFGKTDIQIPDGGITATIRVTYYGARSDANLYTKETLKNVTNIPVHTKDFTTTFDNSTMSVSINADEIYSNYTDGQFPYGWITFDEITPPTGYTTDNLKLTLINGSTEIDITNNAAFRMTNKRETNGKLTPQLYYGNTLISNNATLEIHFEDEYEYEVSTKMLVTSTNNHIGNPMENDKAIDTITVSGIPYNVSLTFDGQLIDKTDDNKIIATGSTSWTSTGHEVVNDELTIEYEYDSTKLRGHILTSVVTVKENNNLVTIHNEDLSDKNETIYYVDGHTTAMDKETQDKVSTVREDTEITLTDTVALENLPVNNTYRLEGILREKDGTENGKDLLVNGNTVTSYIEFTVNADGTINTDKAKDISYNATDGVINGSIEMDFTFSSKDLYDKDIVVFETGYVVVTNTTGEKENIEVFNEKDINDLGQTVHLPKITTLATDDTYENHVGIVSERSSLTEKAQLYNLVYGMDYEITATLMNQLTKTELKDKDNNVIKKSVIVHITDGDTITATDKNDATIKYTVSDIVKHDDDKTVDIVVSIPFVYDSTTVKTTVVYEDLTHNNVIVATHNNPNDTKQQVHYYKFSIHKTGLDDPTKATFEITKNDKLVKFIKDKEKDGVYYIVIVADNDTTTEYVTTLNPNSNGDLEMYGFDASEYILTETKTEQGKSLLRDRFRLTFKPSNDEDADNYLLEKVIIKDGTDKILEATPIDTNEVKVQIDNNSTITLHTGGNGTSMYYIISLLLLFGVCIVVFKKRKTN